MLCLLVTEIIITFVIFIVAKFLHSANTVLLVYRWFCFIHSGGIDGLNTKDTGLVLKMCQQLWSRVSCQGQWLCAEGIFFVAILTRSLPKEEWKAIPVLTVDQNVLDTGSKWVSSASWLSCTGSHFVVNKPMLLLLLLNW